jgi:Domain of unknown function (DUF697)
MAKEPTGSGTPDKKDPVAAHKPTDSGQVEMTPAEREAKATKLVERYSLWSGAGGLIPLPVIDVAVVGGVQVQMLRKLAALYNVPFREDWGKSVLASLVGSLIPASSGMGVASALKSVPIVGTGVGTKENIKSTKEKLSFRSRGADSPADSAPGKAPANT